MGTALPMLAGVGAALNAQLTLLMQAKKLSSKMGL